MSINPLKRLKVRVRRTTRKAAKKAEYTASGFLGVGKISKKAEKERVRRRKARKSTLKKAFKKIW